MEQNLKDGVKDSILTEQNLKGGIFTVSVYRTKDGEETFVISTAQGMPVRIVHSADEVGQFFSKFINEITSENE